MALVNNDAEYQSICVAKECPLAPGAVCNQYENGGFFPEPQAVYGGACGNGGGYSSGGNGGYNNGGNSGYPPKKDDAKKDDGHWHGSGKWRDQ